MLINLTTCPSVKWSDEQKWVATSEWGTVMDYPFPIVDANATIEDILATAQDVADNVVKLHPAAVLVQGEMALTYVLVNLLQKAQISVYTASFARDKITSQDKSGNLVKSSIYRFAQFRRYPNV